MNPARVLVVDDEPKMVELIRSYLVREGMDVLTAPDGRIALDLARGSAPDVIVLDLNLPVVDGLEVLRTVRTYSDAYVILVTARDEEIDRVLGLSLGADDYLVKPFSPRELVARVQALLRRPRTRPVGGEEAPPASGLIVDARRHEVAVDGRPVALTRTEFGLLEALAAEPGVVFTRQQLLDRVWGVDWVGDEHVIDVHLGALRRKLGDTADEPRFIETIRGVGFRLREPVRR